MAETVNEIACEGVELATGCTVKVRRATKNIKVPLCLQLPTPILAFASKTNRPASNS